SGDTQLFKTFCAFEVKTNAKKNEKKNSCFFML
ncbi:MAG: hypothetical protein RL253_42, partial [Bacteroidota bacterium]